VPFGNYRNPGICAAETLRAAGAALAGVELVAGDFEETLADLGQGDFVYLDPPYVPLSSTSNFTDYAEDGFGEADQRRLAEVFHRLDERGCRLLLSNSATPLIEQLYRGRGYNFREVQARRVISCDAATRGPVTELVISNHPLQGKPARRS